MDSLGTVRVHLAGVLTGAMLVGCSGQRLQEKLDPAERAVQPTVNAVECGGKSVQAAISACRAEGGHYGHCAIVASRAGVSDATSCYNYSNLLREHRAQLVGKEDQLDAQIAYLKDVNQDTEGLNAQLRANLAEVTARTDTATASLAQGGMTRAELEQLRQILDVEVSAAERQLDAASRQLRTAQDYRAHLAVPTAALDGEIAELQSLLDEARRQTGELEAQRRRVADSNDSL